MVLMPFNSPEHRYFDRLVNLEREKQSLVDDIKATYDEAKRDPEFEGEIKILRRAVRMHIEDDDKRVARLKTDRAAMELLERLLGGTPLGDAALGK